MQIIKEKQYEQQKENAKLERVSYTSNGTLCFIMKNGTHYNFNDEELQTILKFIEKLNIQK